MNRKLFIAIAAFGLAASASTYAGQVTPTPATPMQASAIGAPVRTSMLRTPVTPARAYTWKNVMFSRGVGDCGSACLRGASIAK
jgi:hypothetical protein